MAVTSLCTSVIKDDEVVGLVAFWAQDRPFPVELVDHQDRLIIRAAGDEFRPIASGRRFLYPHGAWTTVH